MTFPCPNCHGAHGWWIDSAGRRLYRPIEAMPASAPARWNVCMDCIGSTSHCCEGDQEQPEPEERDE